MALGRLQIAFGRNVRAYRTGLGVSQEQFASDSGMHRTYLGAVERGERNLTMQTIEQYCEIWGLEPLDMLNPSFKPWQDIEVDGTLT